MRDKNPVQEGWRKVSLLIWNHHCIRGSLPVGPREVSTEARPHQDALNTAHSPPAQGYNLVPLIQTQASGQQEQSD